MILSKSFALRGYFNHLTRISSSPVNGIYLKARTQNEMKEDINNVSAKVNILEAKVDTIEAKVDNITATLDEIKSFILRLQHNPT